MLNARFRPPTPQHGFTLLEVLLTTVILAFGLLGLSNMQSKIHVTQFEAYQRAQALLLLEDMVGRMNANRANAASYVTGADDPLGPEDSQPVSCAGLTGAAFDLCEWSNALKGAAETQASANTGAMIGARGCIEQIQAPDPTASVCIPGTYRVTVVWQGLNKTTAPSLLCGQGYYSDTTLQRTVSTQLTIALLSCS